MGLTAAEYGRLLLQALPTGRAFSRAPDSRFAGLLEGFGGEASRVDLRFEDLLREVHPGAAVELLPAWEALLGLPDDCAPLGATIAERQAAALAKLGALGDPRPAGLEALALKLGVVVEVEDQLGTNCTEGTCVSPLYGVDWAFAFFVHAPLGEVLYADCTNSNCDDGLAAFGLPALECAIQQHKPAHTAAIFIYE